MQQDSTATEIYTQRLTTFSNQLKDLKSKRSKLGWLRLVIVIATLLAVYSLFFNNGLVGWMLVACGIAAFLYIVSIDADNNEKIQFLEKLLSINVSEIGAQHGNYLNRDNGSIYAPTDHPYAGDIDLFGQASLFQFINRCTADQSKKFFADLLLNPSAKEDILQRQEAAKALASEIDWRQRLQASGMTDPITFETEQKLQQWLSQENPVQGSFWKVLPNIFSAITIATIVAYLFDFISSPVLWLMLLVYLVIAKVISNKVQKIYEALSRINDEVNTVQQQLRLVESIQVSSGLLDQYKATLHQNGSASIRSLKSILQKFDYRLNMLVFYILNTLFLWDLRQANNLEIWKQKNEKYVSYWFEIIANIEVLNTLSTLTYNYLGWCFPTISAQHFTLSARDVGHPLIDSAKRVNNSFITAGMGKVSVITGSNMAGKSTFLRSIGVNLVLAQMGAPVCAKAFTCSLIHLYSSMRIADNLAENTSTFYAELKKLKSIIDQVKTHHKVFILLDEILRGTNSLDRHTGSEALLKQLIKEDAVAIIATHDVELAALKNEYEDSISNYHFDVQVEGEELYFDYKLKEGVCQSMNASLLMKKIGIEM